MSYFKSVASPQNIVYSKPSHPSTGCFGKLDMTQKCVVRTKTPLPIGISPVGEKSVLRGIDVYVNQAQTPNTAQILPRGGDAEGRGG